MSHEGEGQRTKGGRSEGLSEPGGAATSRQLQLFLDQPSEPDQAPRQDHSHVEAELVVFPADVLDPAPSGPARGPVTAVRLDDASAQDDVSSHGCRRLPGRLADLEAGRPPGVQLTVDGMNGRQPGSLDDLGADRAHESPRPGQVRQGRTPGVELEGIEEPGARDDAVGQHTGGTQVEAPDPLTRGSGSPEGGSIPGPRRTRAEPLDGSPSIRGGPTRSQQAA